MKQNCEDKYPTINYVSPNERGDMAEFRGDELISSVAHGHPVETWGPVVIVNWAPKFVNSEYNFQQAYEDFIQHLRSNHPSVTEYCYFYPHATLHTTIATIVPSTFGKDKVNEEDKGHIEEKSTQFVEERISSAPFQLKISDIQLSKDAGILRYEDNDMINNIRKTVSNLPQFLSLDRSTLTDYTKIPSIVHSTFMRFIKVPDDPDLFLDRWNKSIQEFREKGSLLFQQQTLIDGCYLVNELIPYMQSSHSSPHLLASVTFE